VAQALCTFKATDFKTRHILRVQLSVVARSGHGFAQGFILCTREEIAGFTKILRQ
jgi:hypothetical protein